MERVIFLVDMNAFFISCEMARRPELRGVPAAVAGDPKYRSGIILAANYEARAFGIKTTMLLHEAKKLCPNIAFVPPEHRYYEEQSQKVMAILARYSPLIQQNSIDEAWMDMTGCEALFGKPVDTAKRIMQDIKDELNLWCSIGISDNKFLAKMASEMKKPMGITVVWQKDVGDKIWSLPVRQMYGIGKATETKLSNLAIFTIGDLARYNKAILVKAFGKYGEELHRLANGIDHSPVEEHPHHDSKSIGRSTTLPRDTTDMGYSQAVLLRLAEEVGMDARRYGYKGRTVSIVIKYGDFQSITRQKSIKPTYLTKEIYEEGVKLLEENWNSSRPVRLLGISLGNFDEDEMKRLTLFDIEEVGADQKTNNRKEEKLEQAMDVIRNKYGLDKIKRAKLINGDSRE